MRSMLRRIIHKLVVIYTGMLVVFSIGATANDAQTDYFTLDLESLMRVEVISASKKPEAANEVASAIFVITQEDIKRLGATNIPEMLRVVPGLQVAQIDSNKWAITSRGFNNQYANDLLVLIDGRTVYTPVFSGVYWDVQDTLMEDIERIEVIRGPGGTVWGSNAVNGVINIITRSAANTQGTYASVTFGNEERGAIEVRQGGKIGEHTSYRVYAKAKIQDETTIPGGGDRGDGWSREQAGFRVDAEPTPQKKLTVQGDIYHGETESVFIRPSTTSTGFVTNEPSEDTIAGGNVLVRLEQDLGDAGIMTLQSYFDHARRNELLFGQVISTYDMELQHVFKPADRHETVWGAGYRYIQDSADNNALVFFESDSTSFQLWNAFMQHEWEAVEDTLFLTLGSKFEHNDYTGFEYQPSAKMLWKASDTHTLWGSVARAVRIPSRVSDGVRAARSAFPANTVGPGTPAGFVRITGSEALDAERLIAYEMGYRASFDRDMSLDIAAFYNDYASLFTLEQGASFTENGFSILPLTFANRSRGYSVGVETTAKWQVSPKWQLSGSYAWHRISIDTQAGSTDTTQENNETNSPKHQFTLRSSAELGSEVFMDNTLYFVDNIQADGFTSSLAVPDYWRLDTRLSWKPNAHMTLEAIGQNLLDDKHVEFTSPFYMNAAEIGRSVFGRVRLRY